MGLFGIAPPTETVNLHLRFSWIHCGVTSSVELMELKVFGTNSTSISISLPPVPHASRGKIKNCKNKKNAWVSFLPVRTGGEAGSCPWQVRHNQQAGKDTASERGAGAAAGGARGVRRAGSTVQD